MNDPEFLIGLDLGQARDPSALAIIKRQPVRDEAGKEVRDARGNVQHRADVVHLHRWPLGTRYPAIVEEVKALAGRPELAPASVRPRLALDATGVGRAVVDLFLEADLPSDIIPITITAGEGHRHDAWAPGGPTAWWVAKKELVGIVQVGLQTGTLKFAAGLSLAETLKAELLGFQVKVTVSANEQFGAWREGAHDDLVLGVALAVWLGENVHRPHYEPPRVGGRREHLPGWHRPGWGY
jgi:hypothetical protein